MTGERLSVRLLGGGKRPVWLSAAAHPFIAISRSAAVDNNAVASLAHGRSPGQQRWRVGLALLVLVVIGAGLRLHNLGGQGLWHDEMFSLLFGTGQMDEAFRHTDALDLDLQSCRLAIGQTPPWQPDAVFRSIYLREPSHSPFWYLIVHAFLVVLGVSEAALRLPAALCSILTIPVLFLLGRRVHGAALGLIAAALCAVAPLQIFFAQEARMYSQVVLLAALSTWLLLTLSDRYQQAAVPAQRLRWRRLLWLGWTLTTLAGMYTQYLYCVALVPQTLWVILRHRRDRPFRRAWLTTTTLAGLGFAPWPLLRLHFSPPSGVGWLKGALAPMALLDTAWTSARQFVWLDEGWLPELSWLWLATLVAGVVAAAQSRSLRWLPLWAIWPAFAVVAVDTLAVSHASEFNRYFVLGAPATYLLLAAGVLRMPKWLGGAVLSVLIVQMIVTSVWTAEAQILPRNDDPKHVGEHLARPAAADEPVTIVSWDKILLSNLAWYWRGGQKQALVVRDMATLATRPAQARLAGHQTTALVLPMAFGDDEPQPDDAMYRLGGWRRTERARFGQVLVLHYRR